MKYNVKLFFFFLATIFTSAFLISLFSKQNLSLLTLVNNAFLISMTFLIIGVVLFILRANIFTIFHHNFKKFLSHLKGTSKLEKMFEDESSLEERLNQDKPYSVSGPILISGLFTSILLIIISYLYL